MNFDEEDLRAGAALTVKMLSVLDGMSDSEEEKLAICLSLCWMFTARLKLPIEIVSEILCAYKSSQFNYEDDR